MLTAALQSLYREANYCTIHIHETRDIPKGSSVKRLVEMQNKAISVAVSLRSANADWKDLIVNLAHPFRHKNEPNLLWPRRTQTLKIIYPTPARTIPHKFTRACDRPANHTCRRQASHAYAIQWDATNKPLARSLKLAFYVARVVLLALMRAWSWFHL